MEPESAAFRVVEKVAGMEGVTPEELSPPLGTVIDIEALERILQQERGQAATRTAIQFR
jgi:hypothetical protein